MGTPERPLSDLGLVSYRGYWTRELLAILKDPSRSVMSIKDLSELTMIKTEDIISTLQHLNLLAYQKARPVHSLARRASRFDLDDGGLMTESKHPDFLLVVNGPHRSSHRSTHRSTHWFTHRSSHRSSHWSSHRFNGSFGGLGLDGRVSRARAGLLRWRELHGSVRRGRTSSAPPPTSSTSTSRRRDLPEWRWTRRSSSGPRTTPRRNTPTSEGKRVPMY